MILNVLLHLLVFQKIHRPVPKPSSVIVDKDIVTVEVGAKETINVIVLPEEASQKCVFISDDPSIVDVSERGEFVGKKEGNTNVTVKAEADPKIQKKVAVVVVPHLVAPQINKYLETDVYVRGTIGGEATTVALFIDGVQKKTAAVQEDRKYEIYSSGLELNVVGKKFEVAGVKNGIIGPKTTGTVVSAT